MKTEDNLKTFKGVLFQVGTLHKLREFKIQCESVEKAREIVWSRYGVPGTFAAAEKIS